VQKVPVARFARRFSTELADNGGKRQARSLPNRGTQARADDYATVAEWRLYEDNFPVICTDKFKIEKF